MGLRQRLAVRALRFIQKRGARRVEVLGNTYEVTEDVMNPRYSITGRFLAENLDAGPGDEVLDMCTGSGILAVTAAKGGAEVTAVDILPDAVECPRRNAGLNGVGDRVDVLEGDLFDPLEKGRRFDLIILNPPYFDGEVEGGFDRAVFDPGKELARRFFTEAPDFLKTDGRVLMVYSSIARPEDVLAFAGEGRWRHEVVATKGNALERFTLYRFTRPPRRAKEGGRKVREGGKEGGRGGKKE